MKATAPVPNGSGGATAVVARPHRKPPKPKTPAQPHNLLEAIIFAASDPGIDIAKVEHLIRLRKELEVSAAEQDFNNALAAAQAELTAVSRDAENPQTQSRYASLAQLDKALRPVYAKHGFAVTFGCGSYSGDVLEVTAYLSGHGFGRRYSIPMPCDGKGAKGGDAQTKVHAIASATSYGRRYLLCMIFNIVTADDDGNAAGSTIPAHKSSAALKREGVWPTFQAEMRAAKSHKALQAVVERWRPRVQQWSDKWKGAAEELHGQCHERLGGTLAALKQTAEQLDPHSLERLQDDRWHEAWQGDKRRW